MRKVLPGGADSFVGLFERPWLLVAYCRGLGTEVLGAVLGFDTGPGGGNGLLRQVHRVGSHVGDVALFIQVLGYTHGFSGREAQLAVGLLLQGGSRKGRRGLAGGRTLIQAADGSRYRLQFAPAALWPALHSVEQLHALRQCARWIRQSRYL